MQAVTLVTTSLKYSFKTRSLLKHSSNTLMRKTKNYTTEAWPNPLSKLLLVLQPGATSILQNTFMRL